MTESTAADRTDAVESFPRQEAATRRFRLGAPRGFRVAPDGSRACFIRSAGGRDAVGSLWALEVVDGDVVERLVVDARTLVVDDAGLPDAERARRERMRETTAGITAFSTDEALSRAVFCLDGTPYCVDLTAPSAAPVEVAHPGPAVDPQLSPAGSRVAFVSERAVYVAPAFVAPVVEHDEADGYACLAAPETELQSWGLADFVAAEELSRFRGLWWLGEDALLAEFVDEADVAVRWIGDPTYPEREPVAHRYPAAGTENARVGLHVLRRDREPVELHWDHEEFPYLATVEIGTGGSAVISVLSRDQQRQAIWWLDRGAQALSAAGERVTEPWLTLAPGVPTRAPDGGLLEVVADVEQDTFRLVLDGAPLTPPGLQVSSVIHVDDDGVLLTATRDPRDRHVYRVGYDGTVTALTSGPGVHAAAGRSSGMVLATMSLDSPTTRYEARLSGASSMVVSHAEPPVIDAVATFARVTERALSTALLWPSGHVPGSTRLPVIMAPYAGPHVASVIHAQGAFASEQWLADQGFAVVVVDGVGTPGRGPAWEFGVRLDLASGVLDDQVAALHALAALHPDLDLDRVGITGWSFGGFLAALAVLDRPDVFHAAVAGAPVTDWALYDTAYTERYLGLPEEFPEAYSGSSLLPRAAGLQRPLMLIHGLADDNVLAAHSLQLSGELMAAGRPHTFLPLSGVTHMTPQEEVAENLLLLQVQFFATHLT